MSWFRKNPLFATALTVCGLIALGEGWCIYDRIAASRASVAKLEQRRMELTAMADVVPPPKRDVATAIEADLARAQHALAAMQTELKGRGPAAERLHKAKVPAARTDAFFDLASFVERTRDLAKKSDVELRGDAVRLGFAKYANEGPEADLIEPVFHQRQVAQYLIEALIEARPRALLALKRERPVTAKEREDRAAAAAAIAAGNPPPEPTAEAATPEEGPDFFAIDPRASVRAPGFVDSTAYRLVFLGQTAALRAFLNKLGSFELPVLVREVEVEPATTEEMTPSESAESNTASEAASAAAPASIVLSADAPTGKPAAAAATAAVGARRPAARSIAAPIVAKPFSKFTVTVEYVELVPPPAPPADPAATPTPNT